MFLLGSLLAMRIAGTPIPESVELAAMREKSVVGLARNIMRDVADESASTRVDPRRFSFRMLQLRERRRDRRRYIVDTLTEPSSLELRLLPLPRRFRFIYRFMVPFTRYLALPIGYRIRDLIRRFADGERTSSAS